MAWNHNNNTDPNEPDWGSVDKTKLPRVAFADEGEAGQKSTWRFPHHFIRGGGSPDENGVDTTGEMFLHRGGLAAAWAAAQGARSGEEAGSAVKAHLASHREALGLGVEPRSVWALSDAAPGARRIGSELFEKELVRSGRWRHPQGKFVLDVDATRISGWAAAFRKMKAAGVKVPVPYGHSYDARDNAGFVEDVWPLDDGRLMGVIRAPREEDAARLGTTATEVSVSIIPDFVDGKGVHYGEAIEHVAITNYPVIPAQGNFQKIAADATGGPVEIVTLEREGEVMGKENAGSPAGADGGGKTELERLAGEKTALARELEAANAKLAAARGREIDVEIDGLLAKGKIVASDANKADIRALLSADAEGEGSIQLSVKLGEKEEKASPGAVFRRFLSRLPEGCIVKLGRETRGADGKADEDETAKDEAKKNLAAAGMKPRE